MKKLFALIFFFCFGFCSLKASTFPKALECSEDIKDITRLVRTETLPELASRRIENNGVTYGYVTLSKKSRRFFVSFKNFSPFLDFSQCFLGCKKEAREYGLNGNVDKHIYTIENNLRPIIKSLFVEILYASSGSLKIDDPTKNFDYIFCGYGSGGSLASLAALSLVKEGAQLENQVKVITFSASGLGDRDFVKNYHRNIPLYNALNFTRHLDISLSGLWTVGIPIEMTAIEGIGEHVFPSKRTLQKIFWGSLVAVGIYQLYYYRNQSSNFIPAGEKIINIDWEQSNLTKSLTEVAGSTQQAGQILKSDYAKFSSFSNNISSDKRLFGVLDAFLFTTYGLYKFCTMTDISSNDTIMSSYGYTRSRFGRLSPENYEEYLGDIGKISWFGSR